MRWLHDVGSIRQEMTAMGDEAATRHNASLVTIQALGSGVAPPA
jgi:hypothetical protein